MSKLALLLYVFATSIALVVLKLGTKTEALFSYQNNRLHLNFNFYTVAGVVLYGLSFVLYVYLISKNDLGYIIPLTTALVYILIFTASFFIFHETFTVVKLVGISLIVSGLVFLNFSK